MVISIQHITSARPHGLPWHCRGAICGVDTSKTSGVACGSARWSCTSQCQWHVAKRSRSESPMMFDGCFMSFSLQDLDTLINS